MLRMLLILAAGSLALSLVWLKAPLPAIGPGQFPLVFYRHLIDDLDGRTCPSYPVCSRYAQQAIERHGLWLGSLFMLDRLIHEADDLRLGSWVRINGQKRLNDPLSRNDNWLTGEQL